MDIRRKRRRGRARRKRKSKRGVWKGRMMGRTRRRKK